MEENGNTIKINKSIKVSRNTPIAFIVGVGGFIGSHLAEEFLKRGIQVVGIDDFSKGKRKNLEICTRNNKFHLLNGSISDSGFVSYSSSNLELPRIDYAIFTADSEEYTELLTKGVDNFLNFLLSQKKLSHEEAKTKTNDKPKIAFLSSINLYGNKLSDKEKYLKNAEIDFAKFVKKHNLNARVIRLANLYGPRMSFEYDDPTVRLIQATLLDELQKEQTSLDFSSRSIYIEDAVHLVIKALLSGSTSEKIYDGALLQPIKVAEIKQVLLDPLWYETRNFIPTELPPWPTPNLKRSMHDLSWKPETSIIKGLKETVVYFKENEELEVPELSETSYRFTKNWSFKNIDESKEKETPDRGDRNDTKRVEETKKTSETNEDPPKTRLNKIKPFLIFALIFYGLIFPALTLGYGAFSVRNNINASREALERGDFNKAESEVAKAQATVSSFKEGLVLLDPLKQVPYLKKQTTQLGNLTNLANEGIEGLGYAVRGSKSLFETTKVISGEQKGDLPALYQNAQTQLNQASQKMAFVKVGLQDNLENDNIPEYLRPRTEDLTQKFDSYVNLIEKARIASYLLPEITAVGGKRSYLVLLQNNLELRPGGGFIGSYARFNFEDGKIVDIKVDDIYNLDGAMPDVIEPPVDLKTDLGINRLFLRDVNYEPDFPTVARQAALLYKKSTGENVNGVIAIDLSASSKLLDAVGGLDLPEYGEHVNGDNLFERAITHAEVNFFPGSQAKRHYLTSLENQLFSKIFYVSQKNWPSIIQALSESLTQKHIMIYLSDSSLFSYVLSENWGGIMPRGTNIDVANETHDFLATVESNNGANKSNYFLERKYRLETSIGKEGQIFHKLMIDYINNSPSEVFPAGKYKNRMRVYLPIGAKLTKLTWGESDLTSQVKAFSDYGRNAFSVLLELLPKEQKIVSLEYTLAKPLEFKDGVSNYRLDVIKQAGTGMDLFDWNLTYPINLSIESIEGDQMQQELNINTDLSVDRSFTVSFKQK